MKTITDEYIEQKYFLECGDEKIEILKIREGCFRPQRKIQNR